MRICLFQPRRLVLALTLLFALPVESQSSNFHVIWTPAQRIAFSTGAVQFTSVVGEERRSLVPLPPDTIWASWREDGLYALVLTQATIAADAGVSKSTSRLRVLRQAAGLSDWECFAEIPEYLAMSVRAALPTSDGRLFLVPNGAFLPLSDESDWAPFLLMGRDGQGRWNQFEPVNLEWGPPFKKQLGADGRISWKSSSRHYLFLASAQPEAPDLADRLFELQDGWAFVNRHHGLIWVFDAKGKCLRRISLYNQLKDEDLAGSLADFPTAVLGCATAPGDRLILAARNQIAFFVCRKIWPLVSTQGTTLPDLQWRETQAAQDYPEIAWFEVDLMSGSIKSLTQPKGLPSKYVFRPEDPNWHFPISIGLDGGIDTTTPTPNQASVPIPPITPVPHRAD